MVAFSAAALLAVAGVARGASYVYFMPSVDQSAEVSGEASIGSYPLPPSGGQRGQVRGVDKGTRLADWAAKWCTAKCDIAI